MDEQRQVERLALQEQMHRAMMENSPRYLRARRTAMTIQEIMRDFIPQDRRVQRQIEEYLMEVAFQANAEFINVPAEWDALDKLQIERAMLDSKIGPVMDPTFAGIGGFPRN